MGNLSSCIAEHREDRDYLYLERRPPALIAGYETLSHMYYAHTRMAIVHLNNDTGHYLRLKGTYITSGTLMCPRNASGDLEAGGDRSMGFANRGLLSGARGVVIYEIGDTGVHLVIMFRVPRVRKNFGRILRGTNAFALGFVHGPVRATAELYRDRVQWKMEMESNGNRATWFERYEWDGRSELNHAFKHRRFKIAGRMGAGKKALLKVHLLECASAPAPGTRLSGGVSLAAMRVGAVGEGVAWRGGKAVAVDGRGVAHALVVRFEREPATGRQTTLLLQPCVSPGLDGVKLKLMDNSFRLPDKYEERCPGGEIPLPEGVQLIGSVKLGRINMSVEDVLWEADNLSLNERPYHPWRANSLVWARDLAAILGVGPNGRQLRPGGGGSREILGPNGPINMTNCSGAFYGSNSGRTASPAMIREFVQPSMNPIRLPCLIL